MKLAGFLVLLSGCAIVVVALALLANAARTAFILAGIGVEMLGLVLIVRSHLVLKGARD